jgi:hypothetical protein
MSANFLPSEPVQSDPDDRRIGREIVARKPRGLQALREIDRCAKRRFDRLDDAEPTKLYARLSAYDRAVFGRVPCGKGQLAIEPRETSSGASKARLARGGRPVGRANQVL